MSGLDAILKYINDSDDSDMKTIKKGNQTGKLFRFFFYFLTENIFIFIF